MKTIHLQVTLLILFFPYLLLSQHQLKKKTPLLDSTKSSPKISIGIQFGLSFSDISSDRIAFPATEVNLSQLDRQPAINGRLGLQLLIHLSEEYTLETGLIYEKWGLKANGFYDLDLMEYSNKKNSTTHFSFEYLVFPILFKKNFSLTEKMKLNFHIGPYFGFLQSSSYGYEAIDLVTNPDGTFRETMRKVEFPLDDFSRKLDIGFRLQFGAQREVSETVTAFANAFYSRGLRTVDDFSDASLSEEGGGGMHRVWGISVGVFFEVW